MVTAQPTVGWSAWLARWERFQATYIPERAVQFDLIARYAVEFGGRDMVRAIDLCAGPASLGAALLARAPGARVIGVEIDPFLVELGRRGRPQASILWEHADLRHAGWTVPLPGPYDVVLCSTAMHWFNDEETTEIYRETASIVRRRGALIVADTMPHGTATARAAAHAMLERFSAETIRKGDGESWVSFWRAVEEEPAFSELLSKRTALLGQRRPRVAPSLEFHLEALVDAGFADVGEIWRHDGCAVILAIR